MKCTKCNMAVRSEINPITVQQYWYCNQCQYSFGVPDEVKKIPKLIQISETTDSICGVMDDGSLWDGRWVGFNEVHWTKRHQIFLEKG